LIDAGVQIRLHSTVLYNSLYRGDDEMLINQHIHGIAAAYAPVLHLRRRADDGVFATYLPASNRCGTRPRCSADGRQLRDVSGTLPAPDQDFSTVPSKRF
jgi:hypothetical protein